MAGESPDRSKQRESSAEPTSGSAGPVPEARGEGREVRDPRLALAGDSGASGKRGGVDTATKVLSVRDVTPTATKAEDGDAERAQDAAEVADDGEEADAAGGSRDEGEAGSEGAADDARLRDAVVAWVDSANGGKGGPAEAKSAEDVENVEDVVGAEESGEDSDAAEGAKGEAAAETEESDADADSDAEEAAGADEDVEAAAADSAAATDEHTAEDEPEDEPRDKPEAATAPEAADEPEDAPQDSPKAAPKDAPKRPAEDTPKADATPEADDTDDADDAEESLKANEAEESDEVDETGKAPEGDEDPKSGGGAKPKPPVDQPTTMLKLGGAAKSRPTVDQPTTMLKLGAKRPEADAERTGKKPEPEAERTSKFVALKPLDAPETRRPKPSAPAAEATTALPKVPADATAPVPQFGPERTTQQPLPPKPPLDLLAELTNTPPPPETPLRTAVRRVKIWTPLVILLAIVFAIAQALRPLPTPTLALTAKDSYTFDGSRVNLPWPTEGQGWMDVNDIGTMDHFGKQTPVAIGSVAKTMTAYIVLKDHPLKPGQEGPRITVDATAEKEGGYDKDNESTLNTVKEGDKLTEKQALSAIMVPSANNIARLLARWDAGSEAAFVKKMNATAKELGMTGTTYTDPSGLKETTVSTAEDQVKLGNAVVEIPALVAITSASSWKDPSGRNWPNYNQLPYSIGAIGIKTGTTTAAGGNLLFAARKKVGGQTVTVVGAILGQHKPSILDTVNAVSKTALVAAQNALTSAKILKKGDVVGYVDDQLGGHTPVVVTEDVPAVGWAGLKVKLSFASDQVPHTAKAGTKVGTLTVGDGSGGAVRVPVALQEDLTEPGFSDKLTRIL
ncbi:D-alanyl-D-alanine carboxypeptidase [Streptomyces sp. NPDC086766]|uniref:D-alanyl-D-alanine carboxypeptidase n=1 Tax=Streptomyces sp. NPDC086766 TaxID=3365754 RepID=UPI003805F8C7